jgi:hypothetical protein
MSIPIRNNVRKTEKMDVEAVNLCRHKFLKPSINRNEILSIIDSEFPPSGFPEFYGLCS